MTELSEALSALANRCDYLYNFDPEDILRSPKGYDVIRSELIQLEKKYYTKHFVVKDGKNTVIQLKKFLLMMDVIDEEESYWVDEMVLVEIVVNLAEITIDQAIDQFLDACRDADVKSQNISVKLIKTSVKAMT
jgi:hypothetical protein